MTDDPRLTALKFDDPLDTKIGDFTDTVPTQSFSKAMNKLNVIQQNMK